MTKVRRKNRKVKKSRNKILYLIAGLVIAIFIFTAGTMAIMVSDEIEEQQPPQRIEEPHLYVEDVFFLKSNTRADDASLDLTSTVYITNDGLADAMDVKIIAFPIDEDKNLAMDKTEKKIGRIPVQKTSEAEFVINVPSGARHEVELIIFENGRLLLRGSGSVIIQGTHSSTQKYTTREVKGTSNDKDYDGLPDAWEQYYGLNPSDPGDAQNDPDGDGINNLYEYYGNTTPCDTAMDKREDDDGLAMKYGSVGFVGLLVLIIIIIIIFIILITVVRSNPSKRQSRKKSTPQPSWLSSHGGIGSYQHLPYHPGPWACPKCGGLLNNDTCVKCGTQYSINPSQPAQEPNTKYNKNIII